ncbi:MAG: hypothetical protein KTR35_20175 [Gammaproteobacteria bacterium]|nr:hypothetical protein [Gammaproteobacteria bacterium]
MAKPPDISSNDSNIVEVRDLAPDIVEIAGSVSDMTPEQLEARRDALKSMLSASAARYEQFIRNRPPPLAQGVRIKVLSGRNAGKFGVVQDADYIQQRVLVVLQESSTPRWFNFESVRALNEASD